MRTEIFKRDDVFITDEKDHSIITRHTKIDDHHYVYLKSARNRMLLMQADLVIVIINNHIARVIKDRQNGGAYTITSKEYPEYFI